ncbi:MAG: helicase HerA-like domain-containing protein, partial [Nanoarchaeota archaeon]
IINWTNLADGNYSYNISIVDRLNNRNTTATRTIFIDTSTPLLVFNDTLMSVDNANVSRNWTYASVQGNVTEANEVNITFTLYNSSGSYNVTTFTNSARIINWTNLADGNYSYNISIVDRLNNRNTTATRTIFIDTSTPLLVFNDTLMSVDYANVSRNWTYASVQGNVTEANEVNITFTLYNSSGSYNVTTFTNSARIINWTNLADGNYSYNISIVDRLNNRNTTATRRITIDTSAPLIVFNDTLMSADYANVSRNWTYASVQGNVTEVNEVNITFTLYNSSGSYNATTFTNGARIINWTNLADGNYTYNISMTDTFNNRNTTATRRITLDITNPSITTRTSQSNLQYRNVNLTINATDTTSGPQSAYATIAYPNGTVTNFTMSKSGLTFNLTFNLTVFGDYDVNYTLNDSAGNSVTASDYFESYLPRNVSGNVSDSAGKLRNYTFRFNRAGTNITMYNFTSTNYNYTNDELKDRIYDLIIQTENHSLVLESLNLSYNYIPVSIDTFTPDFSISLYKQLVGIGVNGTFSGNATINLTYGTLFNSDTSAVTESGLTIHKCFSWNYTQRACNGNFILFSNKSVDTTNDKVTINTTNFSAYLVTEYTCGNSVCQAAYGEDTSTCSTDCSSGGTTTTGGGGGGGGGGGSGGGSTTTGGKAGTDSGGSSLGVLQVSVAKIEQILNVGEVATEQLVIGNTKKTPAYVRIAISDSLKPVLSLGIASKRDIPYVPSTDVKIENVSEKSDAFNIENRGRFSAGLDNILFTSLLVFLPLAQDDAIEVPAGGSVNVPLIINGTKEGIYKGNILISSDTYNQSVPVKIVVKSKEEKLLDVSITLEKEQFEAGDDVEFKVSTFNLGQVSRYSVTFNYEIVNIDTNEIVVQNEESSIIETSLSLSRSLQLPSNIKPGKYKLSIKASYGEGFAVASASFNVGGRGFAIARLVKEFFPIMMSAIVLAFIIGAGIYYLVTLRKKLFEKKIEERQKDSIYPFPDFLTLPQSKYAHIGLVADAEEKAYLDYTQLNRHTLIAGGTGSGKTVAGMVIVEELIKKGASVVVFDPIGQWTGFAKKNQDVAMKKLYKKFGLSEARAYNPTIVQIDDKTMNVDIMHYINKKGLTILRLDSLGPQKADQFIEQSLDSIYKAQLPETGSLKALVVLDEVHRLLPKYGGKRAYLKLEQAVREFRKWGIGLLMISQVLTDFKGAIRGNIGTEIQMHSRYEGDIKRVRERNGAEISKLISRMGIGVGMVESSSYNKGRPYFIEFRPLLHSQYKLSDKDIKTIVRRSEPVLKEANSVKKEEKKEDVNKKDVEESRKKEKHKQRHTNHSKKHKHVIHRKHKRFHKKHK